MTRHERPATDTAVELPLVVADTPTETEPTPHERRNMLIEAAKDFDAKVKPEAPTELVDRMVAEGKISLQAPELEDEAAEFDWMTDDSIVLRPQLAVAIYQNERGGLVIRQERDWNEDGDTFIVISPENIPAFIDRITDVAGVPSFGGPEPKPVAVRKS